MDIEQKKKLKASMDYDGGGRLSTVANKSNALDAPILIVGLGGTGFDALLATKKLIYDTLNCEKSGDVFTDKPRNIEYLAIDTDKDDETKSLQGVSFNKSNKELQIYTCQDVAGIVKNPDRLPSSIRSWLNTNISNEQVINGAGGVRQLGRLMLMQNIQAATEVIEEKIRRISSTYNNSTPLYVFLFAGICGGTGSGTFLDVPYIIRSVASKLDSMRPVNFTGVLFMPDVNCSKPGIGGVNKAALKKNGYAALKELEYLMNAPKMGDKFVQEYGLYSVGINNAAAVSPYDTCILMSVKDKQGVIQTGNSYDYVINVAAETVLNFVASEPANNAGGNSFAINSFLSNEVNNRITYKALLGKNRRPVSYSYSIAGASSAILPLDDIMSYMTYLAFKKIDKFWNRRPVDAEVVKVLEYFGLESKNQEMLLLSNLPRVQNLDRHTFALIKQTPDMITTDFRAAYTRQVEYINHNAGKMVEQMDSRIQEQNNIINNLFRNLEYGPIYAQQCLYTTSDHLSVTKALDTMAQKFMSSRPTGNQIDAAAKQADMALNNLISSSPILPGAKEKLRNAYIKALENQYQMKMTAYAFEKLADICNAYRNSFIAKNNAIYDSVAELLGTLVELFQKYASIKTETTIDADASGNQTMSWSLVNTPKFIEALEKRMSVDDNLNVDLDSFIRGFYQYLFDNADIWSGERKEDMVQSLNQFISEAFANILNKSMDYYLNFYAVSQGKTLASYCDEIVDKLHSRANIMFPTSNSFAVPVPQPGYSFASIPNNSPQMIKCMKDKVNKDSIVKQSGILERIFMMNFLSATPLSFYADIQDCYENYDQLAKNSPGLHLFEKNKFNNVDWNELPSPYPESEWVSGFCIEEEKRRNRIYREVFDKAVKYGFIVIDHMAIKAYCYWGNPIPVDNILKLENLNPDSEVLDMGAAKRCCIKLKEAMTDVNRLNESHEIPELIPDETVDENGNERVNIAFAKNIFIQMFDIRNKIKEMVENYEYCRETLNKITVDDSVAENYVKAMYLHLIFKKRIEYVYLNRRGEVQSFIELSGRQNRYADFYLYQAYSKLDRRQRDEIEQQIDSIRREMSRSDEDYDKMKLWAEEYHKNLKDILYDLKVDYREIDDGEAYLKVYRMLEEIAEAEYNNF